MPVHLHNKKRIQEPIVALDMHKDLKSTIQIGKFDSGRFRYRERVEDLAWANVNDTKQFKWKAIMKNVYHNRTEFAGIKIDEKTVVDDGIKNLAVFDSFYPGIHLPIVEWKRLYTMEQRLLKAKGLDLKCNFEKGYTCYHEGKCQHDKFAAFSFNFVADRAYTIKPEEYLIDTSNKNGQDICIVGIQGNLVNATEYILGDLFMQQFYLILDYGKYRFAVNGIYTDIKDIQQYGFRDYDPNAPVNPPTETPRAPVWGYIVGGIVIALAVIAIVFFIVIRVKNNRLQNNLAKYEQL